MPEETMQPQEQLDSPNSSPEGPTSLDSTSHPLKSIWIAIPLLSVVFGGILYFYMPYFMNQQPISKPSETPTVDAITDKGILVIGTDATYPPMEFEDSKGTLVGYDIDLGKRIAEDMGVTAEFKKITWDDIFNELLNDEIDIIISSVSITDERKELYDFSIPYINAGQVIITQDSNNTIDDTDDLIGKKIGVQEGTTNQEQALLYTDPENVISYADFIEATQALVEGNVDAIFSDLTNAKGVISQNNSLKIASDPFTSEQYGIVVKQGKPDLVAKLDETVNSLKRKGFLELLKQKWLE